MFYGEQDEAKQSEAKPANGGPSKKQSEIQGIMDYLKLAFATNANPEKALYEIHKELCEFFGEKVSASRQLSSAISDLSVLAFDGHGPAERAHAHRRLHSYFASQGAKPKRVATSAAGRSSKPKPTKTFEQYAADVIYALERREWASRSTSSARRNASQVLASVRAGKRVCLACGVALAPEDGMLAPRSRTVRVCAGCERWERARTNSQAQR